ncbi:MAG: hypothetical protein Q8N69_01700 [bacterium]|nr:hypothetical protein [bacterium]
MLTIELPFRPLKEEQISARMRILQENVLDYPVGLCVIGPWDDFFIAENRETIRRRLAKIDRSRFRIDLHAPLNKEDRNANFFSSQRGFGNWREILDFAEGIGVGVVNAHAALALTFDEINYLGEDGLEEMRQRHIQLVAIGLNDSQEWETQICIENTPDIECARFLDALNGKMETDPREVMYRVAFVEAEDFLDLRQLAPSALATIDVAHLAAMCDSSEIVSKMALVKDMMPHIHLSDASGKWRSHRSPFQTGLIPGKGRIGGRVFREIINFISRLAANRDISVVVEVCDDGDFVASKTSVEALQVLMNWFKGG